MDPDLSLKTEVNADRLRGLAERYSGRKRDALLPFLLEAQAVHGWLPEKVQQLAAETLRVPLAEIHGVIEFYSMLYNEPMAKKVLRVCHDPICHHADGAEFLEGIAAASASTTERGESTDLAIEKVSCLGLCEHAPAALYGDTALGELQAGSLERLSALSDEALTPKVYGYPMLLTERIGKVDPTSVQAYLDAGGFDALHKVTQLNPAEVIKLVADTGILGRGGAMFPVSRKWSFTREAKSEDGTRYFVVNGDESEPGVFKDRVIMEGDPFTIIEAAAIGAYAVGAKKAWIFVRGEYPLAYQRLANAIESARGRGFLGKNIMGVDGFDLEIEIRRGAGAYVCGEETALFEAVEGKRGFPRKKPPYPVTAGLFQKPTAVNNVETLAAVVAALRMGSKQWRALGTEQSPGTKLFCLSGHVQRPGVYEMPFGISIRQMVEMAGGTPSAAPIQAILVGGAAGVFIREDKLDMKLSYEDSRVNDVPLGSGALMVFDASTDLRVVLHQLSRFFSHESCGKCFPCQLGTQRQLEILERGAVSGSFDKADIAALSDIGQAMTQTSLCGLGQTAATAVTSALDLWPEIFS